VMLAGGLEHETANEIVDQEVEAKGVRPKGLILQFNIQHAPRIRSPRPCHRTRKCVTASASRSRGCSRSRSSR
jgi:hypothetical protein